MRIFFWHGNFLVHPNPRKLLANGCPDAGGSKPLRDIGASGRFDPPHLCPPPPRAASSPCELDRRQPPCGATSIPYQSPWCSRPLLAAPHADSCKPNEASGPHYGVGRSHHREGHDHRTRDHEESSVSHPGVFEHLRTLELADRFGRGQNPDRQIKGPLF